MRRRGFVMGIGVVGGTALTGCLHGGSEKIIDRTIEDTSKVWEFDVSAGDTITIAVDNLGTGITAVILRKKRSRRVVLDGQVESERTFTYVAESPEPYQLAVSADRATVTVTLDDQD